MVPRGPLPPPVPEDNLYGLVECRFLWAGCPSCCLTIRVKALALTSGLASSFLHPLLHSWGVAPFTLALWQQYQTSQYKLEKQNAAKWYQKLFADTNRTTISSLRLAGMFIVLITSYRGLPKVIKSLWRLLQHNFSQAGWLVC